MKNNFNAIRLFLAFAVMLEHFGHDIKNFEWVNGAFAVSCFFCISGYLITKSYLSSKNLETYFLKRLKRIYPPIILLSLSMIFFGWVNDFGKTWFLSILNFALFQDTTSLVYWNSDHILNFTRSTGEIFFSNTPFWTLVVELQFYLLLPFILNLWKKDQIQGWGLLIILYLLHFVIRYENDISWAAKNLLRADILVFVDYFVAGIAIALLEIQHGDWFKKNYKTIFFVSWTIVVLICTNVWHDNHLFAKFFFPACLGLGVIMLAAYVPYFGNICFFGDLSYGIYLYHWVIKDVLLFYGIDVIWWRLLATFLVALLSWHIVEKRFLKPKLQSL